MSTTSRPSDRSPGEARSPDDACTATLDGSPQRTCCLPRGHDGLHRWQPPDGHGHFEWG